MNGDRLRNIAFDLGAWWWPSGPHTPWSGSRRPSRQRAFFAALENRPIGRASDGQRISVAPEPEVDLSHHIKQFEDGQPTSTSSLPVPGTWVSHQLRAGESLAVIAQRYGCTIDEIRGWNAIEAGSRPTTGQVLWLKVGG